MVPMRMLKLAIIRIGIALVSCSLPGAAALPLDITKNEQAEANACSDYSNDCKTCLRKGKNCAWFVRVHPDDDGFSSGCVNKEQCINDEDEDEDGGFKGVECYTDTVGTKFSIEETCGDSCEKRDSAGCDDCVTSDGVDCAWYVGGDLTRCVGERQCEGKGTERASCIKGDKNKKDKDSDIDIDIDKKRRTCEVINQKCEQKRNCKKCLNFSKKGANCAWWVSQDGASTKCVGLEQCNEKEFAKLGGECTQRNAFSTKKRNKVVCRKLNDNQPEKPSDCEKNYYRNDCCKKKGCSWVYNTNKKKCGFRRRGSCLSIEECNPSLGDELCNENTCSVLPTCGAAFPNLVDKTAEDAVAFLEDEYGKKTFCLEVLPKGSPVTKDMRCDRIRLFVDRKTKTTIVSIPRVG